MAAVFTILFDFKVEPSSVKTDTQKSKIAGCLESVLRSYLTNLKQINSFNLEDSSLKLYVSGGGSTVTARVYNDGAITLNIEYLKGDGPEPITTFEKVKIIEKAILEKTQELKDSRVIVPIKRNVFPRYFPTSEDRLIEYDFDEVVFEERSPFQKVQIIHSKSLGNMLVLDDLQNMSESDLIYTETLMNRPKESYKDKEILILGGGDGNLLYELLKEQPKHVTMVEIDDVVMKACSKHMRSICGDVLDKRSTPNYDIIVDDCMKVLDELIKEGRQFDYVFGDLTDVPVSDGARELWGFVSNALQKSFKVLKPTGKFMTHVIGTVMKEALMKYENHLAKIQPPVEIERTQAFIPSFMEDWVFFQVSFSNA